MRPAGVEGDLTALGLVPEGDLAWVAGDLPLRIVETGTGLLTYLWPGDYRLIDADGTPRLSASLADGSNELRVTAR